MFRKKPLCYNIYMFKTKSVSRILQYVTSKLQLIPACFFKIIYIKLPALESVLQQLQLNFIIVARRFEYCDNSHSDFIFNT